MLGRLLIPSSTTCVFRTQMGSNAATRRIKQLVAHMSSTTSTANSTSSAKTTTLAMNNEELVLFREQFAAGIYTLNRPKARNALTLDMIHALRAQVRKWNDSELVKMVIGTGQGDFCAGGDVKAIVDSIKTPEKQHEAVTFFRDEFMLDFELSQLQKPYVVIMDGITMGGGVGLCIPAPFRVATERTLFAMPETAIGYFTDVGATHFLSHLDGQLGTYLGLTSHQVKGREVFELGIATHFVPSRNIPLLLDRLSRLEGTDVRTRSDYYSVINEAIEEFYEERNENDPPAYLVNDVREAIDSVFAPKEVSKIMDNLSAITSGSSANVVNSRVQTWAKETEAAIRERSPTSICVTREAIRLAREKDYKSSWEMEMRLAQAYCTTMAGDFVEGVTAKLMKPKRTPIWKPSDLSEVPTKSVEKLLSSDAPLPAGFELPVGGATTVAGSSQGWSYGLPKEDYVQKIVARLNERSKKEKKKDKGGVFKFRERDVLDEISIELRGKHGLGGRVQEILGRKTTLVDGSLVWKEVA